MVADHTSPAAASGLPLGGGGGTQTVKSAVSRPALVAGLHRYRLSHSALCVCLLTVELAPIHAHKRITTQCVTRQDRHSTATACNTRQGAQAQILSDCLMRLLLGCWAGHPARRASRRRDAKKAPIRGYLVAPIQIIPQDAKDAHRGKITQFRGVSGGRTEK